MMKMLCTMFVAAMLLAAPGTALAGDKPIAQRIAAVMQRPEFRHSIFGIEFYDIDSKRVVYKLNADQLFAPASTTKLVTEGTILASLGPNFRFHTRVYATAPISSDGTLNGDLVLVGSGDPDLSGRILPDGTLSFQNEDHAYDGEAVAGDPLLVIRELAAQVAKRVKKLNGHVLVDASLFPEADVQAETGATSPIVVNDNIIDVTIGPGGAVGAPASLTPSPQTGYVHFSNHVVTSAHGSKSTVKVDSDSAIADGTRAVTFSGSFPLGTAPTLTAYFVPSPSTFAQTTLSEALAADGVAMSASPAALPEPRSGREVYAAANVVAEHVSLPISEDVKVTLKVSQNLHADLGPYLLGAYAGHATDDVQQAGFDVERRFLQNAGLDLTAASIADGAGTAYISPAFIVAYLTYMTHHPVFPVLYSALPILGRDGTLYDIQTASPAAGKVHAKTGTCTQPDLLNRKVTAYSKGLAGYVTSKHGRHIVFAVYIDNTTVDSEAAVTNVIGQAVGEIAAMGYDL